MSHDELVNMISERAGISKQTVRDVLHTVTDVWSQEILARGDLELDHIGEFVIEHRHGRKGLDSERREILIIPPRDVISFVPSRELIDWSNKTS